MATVQEMDRAVQCPGIGIGWPLSVQMRPPEQEFMSETSVTQSLEHCAWHWPLPHQVSRIAQDFPEPPLQSEFREHSLWQPVHKGIEQMSTATTIWRRGEIQPVIFIFSPSYIVSGVTAVHVTLDAELVQTAARDPL